jgi:chemotaxis protein methyltransferase CheR
MNFTEPATLDKKTFKKIVELVYDKCGICLSEKKEALVQARVSKRMRKLGIDDFRSYMKCVEDDTSGEELTALLDAISTNVTHFFRENRHFELMTEIMQQWEAEGQSRFRIWSAASSSGQEPYSIAITLQECMQSCHDIKILGTDISTTVLKKAREGIYEQKHIETVPRPLLTKYFNKISSNGTPHYQVKPVLKNMVTYGRLNLAKPPFPLKGPLDIIMCRNVMIYFDNIIRSQLLKNMYTLLKPGGYLMVGHAESLSGILCDMTSVEPSVYIKK